MSIPFSHVVKIDGEAIRNFRSLREAKWFTENKPNAIIERLPIEKKESVYDEASRLCGFAPY